MQVNLHGSFCITTVFLYCYGHIEKKRNLAQSQRKYAILTLKPKTIFLGRSTVSSFLCYFKRSNHVQSSGGRIKSLIRAVSVSEVTDIKRRRCRRLQ